MSDDPLGEFFVVTIQEAQKSETRDKHDGAFERFESGNGSESFMGNGLGHGESLEMKWKRAMSRHKKAAT